MSNEQQENRQREVLYFSCDFETTVYSGQTRTEVWAATLVQFWTENVIIFNSLTEFFNYVFSLSTDSILYFHNLKFDGSFILDYFLIQQGWKEYIPKDHTKRVKPREMPSKTLTYSISARGQWYVIKLKKGSRIIEIRDSLKLLPFSVKELGKTFGTKHRKLTMEYTGVRYAGCNITSEEQAYIANDVLVVKEALEIMFSQGHKKLTIGACCMEEFKRGYDKLSYKTLFPDLYEHKLDTTVYKQDNLGEYIRTAYRGGWCYLVKGKENKRVHNGITADVNSLYPSVMHSSSGNVYPTGDGHMWVGNYIPEEAISTKESPRYYYLRIRTKFKIKPNHLPCIQIKRNALYKSTEWLETSDIYWPGGNDASGKYLEPQYFDYWINENNERVETFVELTLTCTDWVLINDQYDLIDCEILNGVWFYAQAGLFDEYIDKYKQIKETNKGAIRTLAKLFLNNLYGKLASTTDSSYKQVVEGDIDQLSFITMLENAKKPGYIAAGAAVTSYARNFTIRAAQQNYYGVGQPGFIYADTDSIHCDITADKVKGITIHPTHFNAWKLESYWSDAIFVRQKTYIEYITHNDGKEIEHPHYDIKCAGMQSKCKYFLERVLSGYLLTEKEDKDDEYYLKDDDAYIRFLDGEKEFLKHAKTLEDFKVGIQVPGALRPKRMPGGIVLEDGFYEMRWSR